MTLLDLKSVLQLKCYSIFPTKSVLNPEGQTHKKKYFSKFYKEFHFLLVYRKIQKKILKTRFFTFFFSQKCKKKNHRSLGSVSYRILSFSHQDQFLYCKRYLIGSGGTLIWRHQVCPPEAFQGWGSRSVQFKCYFFTFL